jgi:hypothetical protein
MIHWREVAQRAAYWTVPPGFRDLLHPLLTSRILTVEERALLQRNRVLQNAHVGQRCFILATGPSIKSQDLKALQGETCISVSNFFVHPDYHLIAPRYHCVAGYHPPITEEGWIAWMKEAEARTGDATFFCSLADHRRHQAAGVGAGRSVHYLHCGGPAVSRQPGADLTKQIIGPASVPVMALQVAIYMGFTHIYLLGCDHDWILHLNTSSHFYSEDQHALKRRGYNEWSGDDVESECRNYVLLWQQYKALRSIARSKSIAIMNSTPGGMLDVFPRVPLETVCLKSVS